MFSISEGVELQMYGFADPANKHLIGVILEMFLVGDIASAIQVNSFVYDFIILTFFVDDKKHVVECVYDTFVCEGFACELL